MRKERVESKKLERALSFIKMLQDARIPIPLSSFNQNQWGDERTFRRLRTEINEVWQSLHGKPLFQVTDSDGSAAQKGERFIKLTDTRLQHARSSQFAVICAAMSCLEIMRGTIIDDEFNTITAPLISSLSRAEKTRFARLKKKFHYVCKGFVDHSCQNGVLDEVYNSLVKEWHLHIWTEKDPERMRRVKPLSLLMFNNRLYLALQFDDEGDRNKVYKFKLSSITRAETIRASSFEYPAAFDPRAMFSDDFGFITKKGENSFTVRLEFKEDSSIASYIKSHQWTGNERYMTTEDGITTIEMQVTDLREIKSWVLSMGKEVKVMAPDLLRDEVKEEIEKLLSFYKPCA